MEEASDQDFERAEDLLEYVTPSDSRWHVGTRSGYSIAEAEPIPAEHQIEWIFRGQRDARWSLIPSACREDAWPKSWQGPQTTLSLQPWQLRPRVECQALQRFVQYADIAGIHIPGDSTTLRTAVFTPDQTGLWPSPEVLPVLALARHHGLPTRLLDWTRSPFVASFFAAQLDRGDADRFAVWATKAFVTRQRPQTSSSTTATLHFVRGLASSGNVRMCAQAGLFTVLRVNLSGEGEKPPVDQKTAFDLGPGTLVKFTLPSSEAPRLRKMLWSYYAIAPHTVFPGLDGIVSSALDSLALDRTLL